MPKLDKFLQKVKLQADLCNNKHKNPNKYEYQIKQSDICKSIHIFMKWGLLQKY